MTGPKKETDSNFDAAVNASRGDLPARKEDWIPISPAGTEGCLWDLDYSYLDEEEGVKDDPASC